MEWPLSVSLHDLPEESKGALQNVLGTERVESLQAEFKKISGLEGSIDLAPLLPREHFIKHVLEKQCIPGVHTEAMADYVSRAFNTSRTSKLRCSEYVLGILAFTTPVKSDWPQFDCFLRARKEMLFTMYDLRQPYGLLDIGELEAVAAKMRLHAGRPPLDNLALREASAAAMGIFDEEELLGACCTREMFIESICERLPLACGGLHVLPLRRGLAARTFEGTISVEELLSKEATILSFLKKDLSIPHEELEEQMQRYNKFATTKNSIRQKRSASRPLQSYTTLPIT
jgi:hypothetical protein